MVLRVVNTPDTKPSTLYFGYGSNLWKAQMRKRCPDSTYEGIARLNGYRWIINDRGYANVVQIATAKPDNDGDGDEDGDEGSDGDEDVVWGLVYTLTPTDEAKLDINEGVPVAYTKEDLMVDYWPSHHHKKPDTETDSKQTEMLVYIDRQRTEPDEPKREYIYRMNMGIQDAVAEGMPAGYVEGVLRGFIPEMDGKKGGDDEVRRLAKKQAERFEDEA